MIKLTHQQASQQGMILVSIIGIMLFLGLILIGVFSLATSNLVRSKGRILQLESQYAAESGADSAIAVLNSGNDTYTGTPTEVQVLNTGQYKATYSVAVAAGSTPKERQLTAVGRIYSPSTASTAKYVRTIRVTTQRSSTSAASSIVSRNILALNSGIKNVFARDLTVNGYINMAKNTTNIVAQNITVAGKNTGSSNCSIGGSGNLVKPSSFNDPAQTKTNITMAFNNCITPPGNSSNTNFNVLANQNNVPTVQSTYIPVSQYMDSSYTNSPSGCADWTTGGTTRNIPASAGSKQTHYPDSGSTISASCGTSGDINLGSNTYNITDNAHIRASLCAAAACNPSFYNPNPTIKFIFVEGSINFGSVQTLAGSGPIAIVSYGADPSSKTSVCPYGGSTYIGNSGTTAAPALYMLATNGICLDKTKFSASPALGGIGGKNIYISTNPGSPFDLTLDPNFPTGLIPIDLAWRAVRYLRL
jgi:hypothetical protein